MREILFRGKRKDNGEWLSGRNILWTQNKEGVYIVPTGHPISALCWGGCSDTTMMIPFVEVDPETVGQFTGLTDKYGKKLFEGDIVEVELDGVYEGKYKCRWDEGNFEFGLSDKIESFGIAYISPAGIEIISNIHDNPELLEAE